mgnify:CR=1 FL=1
MLCDKHVLGGKLWQCRKLLLSLGKQLVRIAKYNKILTCRCQNRKPDAQEKNVEYQADNSIDESAKIKNKHKNSSFQMVLRPIKIVACYGIGESLGSQLRSLDSLFTNCV